MTATETADAPRPYGYLATLGWALLAAFLSVAASAVALYAWYPDLISGGLLDLKYDGLLFARLTLAATVAQVALVALAAQLRRWPVADYLGLTLPTGRETAIALACLVAWVLGTDAVTYLLGKDVITPFQIELYQSARAAGALLPLWITLALIGPAGEEIMFRGFLYRGWARTPRAVWPAIVVISAAWAVIHVQYDWFGILQVFLTGLLLGWVRWRSGSTLLTLLLHGLMNAWATVETIIKLDWLS